MPHQPAHGGSTPPEGKLNCFITGADTRSTVAGKLGPENERERERGKLFFFFFGFDYSDLSALEISVFFSLS